MVATFFFNGFMYNSGFFGRGISCALFTLDDFMYTFVISKSDLKKCVKRLNPCGGEQETGFLRHLQKMAYLRDKFK